MVELVIILAVIMVITAVSVPYFLQAYGIYQLNDAATQVAGILKFTRYEAIRLNVPSATPLKARTFRSTAGTYVFTDSNNSGTVQTSDKQAIFNGLTNLVDPGVPPNTGALANAVGVATLTNLSITNGSVGFDQRGAATPAGFYVLYVGSVARQKYGYRAVILLPSGSVQIWTADATASTGWQQLN